MSDCDRGGDKPGRGGKWSAEPLTADQRQLAADWVGAAYGAARRWSRRKPHLSQEFESAALLAVCTAAKNFDPSRGHKFFTYMKHHLRHARKEVMRLATPKGYRLTGSLRRNPAALERVMPALMPWDAEKDEGMSDVVGFDRDVVGEVDQVGADRARVAGLLDKLSPARRALILRTVLGSESVGAVARDIGLSQRSAEEVRRLALRQLGIKLGSGRRILPLEE